MTAEANRRARCCVVGGGPAGMMAGYLLARAGIDVVVLEKHADFFRDFRGDTIHPSTLRIMDELGLLDEFLKVPHNEALQLGARFGDAILPAADFRHVPGPCKFMAFMPQWDFLNFLAEKARALPTFRLEMNAEATDLIRDGERIDGVVAKTPDGPLEIHADLVICAEGRNSTLRERAGLRPLDIGSPIDVLWLRLSRRPEDPTDALGSFAPGGVLIAIDRHDYFQCAFVIPKGGYDAVKVRGLPALGEEIAKLAPFLADRVGELTSWDQVKLLSVTIDRLREWSLPGLLFIGDAAHAMSPIGGVGINLAIQDAVAAANALAGPLAAAGPIARSVLEAVQRRRLMPVRLVQAIQVALQKFVIGNLLDVRSSTAIPWPFRLLGAIPPLRRIPAYVIGIGFRPERVQTPAVTQTPPAAGA